MRWHAVIAVVLAAIALVANVGGLLLAVDWVVIAFVFALGTFAGVGLVVALRRPRHPVGWLFLIAGTCFALALFLVGYSYRALVDAPGTLPAGEVAIWLNLVWMPAIGSMLIAVMLFPNGRPLSRRWAIAIAAMSAAFAVVLLSAAFAPAPLMLLGPPTDGPVQVRVAIPNPFGVGGPLGDVLLALRPFSDGGTVVLLFVLLALVAVVLRFVRSSGTERLQLKWFAYAASVSLVVFILVIGLPLPGSAAAIAQTVAGTSLGLIPVGAGIAILRYRLYDIDVLINRTLVYGALTAALAATYFVAVVVLQAILRPLTGGGEVAVALSTLAVVALFTPLRRRTQAAVDRRFYRSRYDAQRTLDAFGGRLRDQVDLDSVRADLLDVVHETLRPAQAGVWLRRNDSRTPPA